MRVIGTVIGFAFTVVAAAAIGFGVPLGWIWIGSQLQGDSGASNVNFSVAMAILFGIIATYVLLLYLAGIVMALLTPSETPSQHAASRNPWMRGMTESRPKRPGESSVGGIERVFVTTTIIVSVAFWIWFAFAAGSPLPSQ
jgi:hypothetical protein